MYFISIFQLCRSSGTVPVLFYLFLNYRCTIAGCAKMGIILDFIPAPLIRLRHTYRQIGSSTPTAYLFIACSLILISYTYLSRKKQRLVPGILVVGGDDKPSIRKNREKFRQSAKDMLEEGYHKVSNDKTSSYTAHFGF
jgi:hypothetical protein